ncbi:hypothetical protein M885DRAFT_612779 [Pelagophyceae sp. CCMP2097]|nr:hypothetical protein M885DRAFT_612779 [Pelagophyceae sp. CCMP2097]|mmetsp:Transcript_13698/g.45696  ORF Transcript_13698/g.45696 Transcript_13698/m.45696 type:complete len:129 (-) Transcript_13698:45-431(-)
MPGEDRDIVEQVAHMLLEDSAFADRLEAWCEERCCEFELADGAREEHTLRYTELYQEFCLLFEHRIESFLVAKGFSVSAFWQRLTKAIDDEAFALDGDAFLLESLKAATNYLEFYNTMKHMRRDRSGK